MRGQFPLRLYCCFYFFEIRSRHSSSLRGKQDRCWAGHGQEEVQLPSDAPAALLFCTLADVVLDCLGHSSPAFSWLAILSRAFSIVSQVSCADGTNVVRVFKEAISLAIKNKEHPPDEVLASWLQNSCGDLPLKNRILSSKVRICLCFVRPKSTRCWRRMAAPPRPTTLQKWPMMKLRRRLCLWTHHCHRPGCPDRMRVMTDMYEDEKHSGLHRPTQTLHDCNDGNDLKTTGLGKSDMRFHGEIHGEGLVACRNAIKRSSRPRHHLPEAAEAWGWQDGRSQWRLKMVDMCHYAENYEPFTW